MKYIVHQRYRGKSLCGDINIPAMTECESVGRFITIDGKPICAITSEVAHQYFAINEDGEGMTRGRFIIAIQKKLIQSKQLWGKIWDDPLCQPYKRTDHEDTWLWNQAWYEAPVGTFRYVAKLIDLTVDE